MGTTSSSYEDIYTPSDSTTIDSGEDDHENESPDESEDDEEGDDRDKDDENKDNEEDKDDEDDAGQNALDLSSIAVWREKVYTPGWSRREGCEFETIDISGL